MAVDDVLALYKVKTAPVYFENAQLEQITDRLKHLKNISKIFHTGLNTGHHAEAFLTHSKHLQWFVSCDIVNDAHTDKIANYLSQLFPDKFCFLKGHSKIVIPLHAKVIEEIKFDMIFVDGQKHCDDIVSEIVQSKLISHENTCLWIDNYHAENVKRACDLLVNMQQIEITKKHRSQSEEKPCAWIEAKFKN